MKISHMFPMYWKDHQARGLKKKRLKKQKSKEGSTSNMEDLLNVMVEERRDINEMKIAIIEKGRLAIHEQEMTRIHFED